MNWFLHELDAIGKEAMIQSIYAHVRPIDEHLPSEAVVNRSAPLDRVREGLDALEQSVEWQVRVP